MPPASAAFDGLLQRLEAQHQKFLKDAQNALIEGLKLENQLLAQELAVLKAALDAPRAPVAVSPAVVAPPTPDNPPLLLPTAPAATLLVSTLSDDAASEGGCTPGGSTSVRGSVTRRRWPRNGGGGGETRALDPEFVHRYASYEEAFSSDAVLSWTPTIRSRTAPATSPPSMFSVMPPGIIEAQPQDSAPQGRGSVLRESRFVLEDDASCTSKADVMSRGSDACVCRAASNLEIIEVLEDKQKSKERRRLMGLLKVSQTHDFVTADMLIAALQSRTATFDLDEQRVRKVFAEFTALHRHFLCSDETSEHSSDEHLAFDDFMAILGRADLLEVVDEGIANDVSIVKSTLRITTVMEVIEDATKGANEGGYDKSVAQIRSGGWEGWLNMVVTFATFISVCAMGISVDRSPEHPAWFIVETFCTAVFTVDVISKLYWRGIRQYFCGEAAYWNHVDVCTTVVSVVETLVTFATNFVGRGHKSAAGSARVVLVMRALRLVRLVRVMMLQSFLLKDLAKMLVGFVIGIPSLIWVLFLFLVVLFALGLVFRYSLGPAYGQDLRSQCGDGDMETAHFYDPVCGVHYLYGEEFFGTLPKAMFTTFRFMIGDAFSRGGNSLIVAFSEGYGAKFDLFFTGFMIVVMFGLFNIITAIFVDSTTTGLKFNDHKRKLAEMYEGKYVKGKLWDLVMRIQTLCFEIHNPTGRRNSFVGRRITHAKVSEHDFELTHEDFVAVMEDAQVRALLRDLDVEMFNADLLFDTFDPEGDGIVNVQNLVTAVIKLRGSPQKNDIVASWVAVRTLIEKFDQFQLRTYEGQSKIEANQRWMIKALASLGMLSPSGEAAVATDRMQSAGTISQALRTSRELPPL